MFREITQHEIRIDAERLYDTMPPLHFPSDIGIKIIPPYSGATVRFLAIKGDCCVSVYLDCHDRLGIVGEPYWEIHPSVDGEDCDRFLLAETDQLIAAISQSLKNMELR